MPAGVPKQHTPNGWRLSEGPIPRRPEARGGGPGRRVPWPVERRERRSRQYAGHHPVRPTLVFPQRVPRTTARACRAPLARSLHGRRGREAGHCEATALGGGPSGDRARRNYPRLSMPGSVRDAEPASRAARRRSWRVPTSAWCALHHADASNGSHDECAPCRRCALARADPAARPARRLRTVRASVPHQCHARRDRLAARASMVGGPGFDAGYWRSAAHIRACHRAIPARPTAPTPRQR